MMGRVGRFLRSNIIGLVALFFALSGVAYALPGTDTVDSGDIINGSVKSVDIRDSAVTAVKMAPSVRPRWARVNVAGPSIVRDRGATTVSDTGVGSFNVNFETPVNNCGWTVTLNTMTNEEPHIAGEISVKPAGTHALSLQYFTSAGSVAEFPSTDRGFTIAVHC